MPKRATTHELPATAWAVLGLLSFGRELSGYDLKKWADSSLRFFYWSPAASQIYAELRRLEGLGYVRSRSPKDADARGRRVFRITAAGRRAITAWMQRTEVEPPVLKHGVALRVWLGHLAELEELRAVVDAHRRRSEAMAAEAAEAARASAAGGWELPTIVTRWSERYYECERRLAEELLVELDALSARRASAAAGDVEDRPHRERRAR